MKYICLVVCILTFLVSNSFAQDCVIPPYKNYENFSDDSIKNGAVFSYDIVRAKGKHRPKRNMKPENKKEPDLNFDVPPYQVIHIEPVDSAELHSYFIPFLMKGEKGKQIKAKLINTNKTEYSITGFCIDVDDDNDIYNVVIRYSKTGGEKGKPSILECLNNCKGVDFSGGWRMDVHLDDSSSKIAGAGKICRGFTR